MRDSLESISTAAGDCLERGDLDQALVLFTRAVALAEAADDQAALSGLLGDLAVTHRRRGDIPAAIHTNRRAIEAARACGHDLNVARWSGNLGGLLMHAGETDAAEGCFRDAALAAARTGLPDQMSIAGGHLAAIMGARGRFSEAMEIMREALDRARGTPAVAAIIRRQSLDLAGQWAFQLRSRGQVRQAREVIEDALPPDADDPTDAAAVRLLVLLADLHENDGDVVTASAVLERAAGISDGLGDPAQARELRTLSQRIRS